MAWKFVLLATLVMSLVTFAAYALDKRAAIRGTRRTRERTLLSSFSGFSSAGLAGWRPSACCGTRREMCGSSCSSG